MPKLDKSQRGGRHQNGESHSRKQSVGRVLVSAYSRRRLRIRSWWVELHVDFVLDPTDSLACSSALLWHTAPRHNFAAPLIFTAFHCFVFLYHHLRINSTPATALIKTTTSSNATVTPTRIALETSRTQVPATKGLFPPPTGATNNVRS